MGTTITHDETIPVAVNINTLRELDVFEYSGSIYAVVIPAVATTAGKAVKLDDSREALSTAAGMMVVPYPANLVVTNP